jgi:hypothetical protein
MDRKEKIAALKECIRTLEDEEESEYVNCFGHEAFEKYGFSEYEFIKKLKESGGVLAGSFVLNECMYRNDLKIFEAKGMDIFFHYENKGVEIMIEFLKEKGYNLITNYTNVHSVTSYSKDKSFVEIICVKKEPIEHIFEADLDCCRIYYNLDDNKIYSKKGWMMNYNTKFNIGLETCNTINCAKINRLKKYIDRGFYIYIEGKKINDLIEFLYFYTHKYPYADSFNVYEGFCLYLQKL